MPNNLLNIHDAIIRSIGLIIEDNNLGLKKLCNSSNMFC